MKFAELGEIFRKYPEIQAVYLFGSVAEGWAHAESDLDLAIFSDDPGLEEKKLEILTEIVCAGFDRGGTFSRIVRKFWDFQYFLRHQREAVKRAAYGRA